MKKQRKYLFTAALFSLLIGCEKDIDNTVPGNPKERIEARCQDFNRIFTANTEKGKIWISDALYYPYYPRRDYVPPGKRISLPFFIALSPKEENNTNIYATILYDTIQKDSPKDEFGLLSNPNQYSIKGTPILSFSISKQSVLSSLSIMTGISDFDFDVYQYNQDSIHLKSIHQVAHNKEVIFRSYDFNDNVKAFFSACQNLFDIWLDSHYSTYDFSSSWESKYVSFFIKDSKNTVLLEKEIAFSGFFYHLSHMVEPCYNKEKKVFAFKVKPYHKYRFKPIIRLLRRYRIKYLIPVSATENKMVFSGLGKKLDSEGKVTEEDETYTISFR